MSLAPRLVLSLALLVGCGSTEPQTPQADTATQLFFGLSRPDGGEVSDADFMSFVDDVIATKFPTGFTVVDGRGSWLDHTTGEIHREPSRVVTIVHDRDRATEVLLWEIAESYRQRFAQRAVLRVDTSARQLIYDGTESR